LEATDSGVVLAVCPRELARCRPGSRQLLRSARPARRRLGMGRGSERHAGLGRQPGARRSGRDALLRERCAHDGAEGELRCPDADRDALEHAGLVHQLDAGISLCFRPARSFHAMRTVALRLTLLALAPRTNAEPAYPPQSIYQMSAALTDQS